MSTDSDTANIRHCLRQRGICVVIPTYNNVGSIRRVVEDAQRYCDDVFVVDDGSNDGTTGILQGIPGVRLVSYPANRGKGHAIKQGFAAALQAGFAYAITMDADGQHYAKDIPAFLEANRQWPGCIILGKRKLQNAIRSKGSSFANHFSNFWFFVETGHWLDDTQTGFRLYPLRKLHGYRMLTSRYEAELELLVFSSWHGVGIHSIPIDVYYPPKEERVSHFRPAWDFTRISILNTVLCVLAIIYGLPCTLWRKAATLLRTAWAILFVVFSLLIVITPAVWMYVKAGRMTEKKKWRLHLLIYHYARFVVHKMGIPGTRFSQSVSAEADFDKPSVLICNHQSHLDLVYLLMLSPKMVFLTNDWVWRSPFYGFLIRNAEYYPVSRGIDELLPKLQSLADRGYSIAIFPEGTRSASCKVSKFRHGAFHVAEQLGLGITPMILYGAGRVLRKHTHVLRKSPVHLEVGKPYTQDELKSIGGVREQTKFFRRMYAKWYEELSDKIEQHV